MRHLNVQDRVKRLSGHLHGHKYHRNTHRTGSTWCPQVFSQPRTFSRSAPQPVLLHDSTLLVDPSRLYPLKEGLVYRRHSCVWYRAANGFPWKYSGMPAYHKCIAVPGIYVRGTRELNSNKEVILVLLAMILKIIHNPTILWNPFDKAQWPYVYTSYVIGLAWDSFFVILCLLIIDYQNIRCGTAIQHNPTPAPLTSPTQGCQPSRFQPRRTHSTIKFLRFEYQNRNWLLSMRVFLRTSWTAIARH